MTRNKHRHGRPRSGTTRSSQTSPGRCDATPLPLSQPTAGRRDHCESEMMGEERQDHDCRASTVSLSKDLSTCTTTTNSQWLSSGCCCSLNELDGRLTGLLETPALPQFEPISSLYREIWVEHIGCPPPTPQAADGVGRESRTLYEDLSCDIASNLVDISKSLHANSDLHFSDATLIIRVQDIAAQLLQDASKGQARFSESMREVFDLLDLYEHCVVDQRFATDYFVCLLYACRDHQRYLALLDPRAAQKLVALNNDRRLLLEKVKALGYTLVISQKVWAAVDYLAAIHPEQVSCLCRYSFRYKEFESFFLKLLWRRVPELKQDRPKSDQPKIDKLAELFLHLLDKKRSINVEEDRLEKAEANRRGESVLNFRGHHAKEADAFLDLVLDDPDGPPSPTRSKRSKKKKHHYKRDSKRSRDGAASSKGQESAERPECVNCVMSEIRATSLAAKETGGHHIGSRCPAGNGSVAESTTETSRACKTLAQKTSVPRHSSQSHSAGSRDDAVKTEDTARLLSDFEELSFRQRYRLFVEIVLWQRPESKEHLDRVEVVADMILDLEEVNGAKVFDLSLLVRLSGTLYDSARLVSSPMSLEDTERLHLLGKETIRRARLEDDSWSLAREKVSTNAAAPPTSSTMQAINIESDVAHDQKNISLDFRPLETLVASGPPTPSGAKQSTLPSEKGKRGLRFIDVHQSRESTIDTGDSLSLAQRRERLTSGEKVPLKIDTSSPVPLWPQGVPWSPTDGPRPDFSDPPRSLSRDLRSLIFHRNQTRALEAAEACGASSKQKIQAISTLSTEGEPSAGSVVSHAPLQNVMSVSDSSNSSPSSLSGKTCQVLEVRRQLDALSAWVQSLGLCREQV